MRRRVLGALFWMLGAGGVAEAAPLAVVNAGFEDITGEFVLNEFTFGPPPGWSLYDPAGITAGGAGAVYFVGTLTPFVADPIGAPGVFTNIPAGAPEGQRVAINFNFAGSGGQGEYGLEQTLSDLLNPHTRYTLEVDVINIASGTARSGDFFDLSGFPGYRVELRAGDALLAADQNSLAASLGEGQVGTSVISFDSGATPLGLGQALTLRLVNLNVVDPAHPGANLEVDFDNVRLTAAPIPLPSAAPLLLAACALLGWRRQRRT